MQLIDYICKHCTKVLLALLEHWKDQILAPMTTMLTNMKCLTTKYMK